MPAVLRHVATVAVAAAIAVAGVPPAAAQAADPIQLSTTIGTPDVPVPGGPTWIGLSVVNHSEQTATGVEALLELPPGVAVTDEPAPLDDQCTATATATGTTVTCTLDDVGSNTDTGIGIPVTFAATGTYHLTADAVADQPDDDGNATSAADVVVVDEDADLYGLDGGEQVLAGQTVLVHHVFRSHGPTSFAGAQVTGTFPAGLVPVPGAFWFSFDETRAATDCTITAAGFTCGPVHGDASSWIDDAYVAYQAVAHDVGPIEATAAIVGRADPDHGNDTSTFRVDVVDPAADLYVPAGSTYDTWYGQETHELVANLVNFGELPAEATTVTVEVPVGWTVDAPPDPDPPDRTCAVAPGGASVTCTYVAVEAFGAYRSFQVPVTSPAGPSAPGIATISASTTTPEHDQYPNVTAIGLRHVGGIDPAVAVTPATGLVDGQVVDVAVTGFTPDTFVGTAVCDTASSTPSLDRCDLTTVQTATTDGSGAVTLTRAVPRFAITSAGVLDCAQADCVLGVATPDLRFVATTPIAFEPGPPADGIEVALGAPAYLLGPGPSGPATIPATLSCATASTVTVEFGLHQPPEAGGSPTIARSTLTVPCTPGTPMSVISDLTGDLVPGVTGVLVRATDGDARAAVAGEVVVESAATAQAMLAARLADPDDTTALAELVAAFEFRLQYNPEFRRALWRAIVAGA